MKKIRVIQWGLGAMGSGMARLVLEKDGLELVGGINCISIAEEMATTSSSMSRTRRRM